MPRRENFVITMEFIKPKHIDKENVRWKISKRTQLIISYYSKYSGYTEDEVADMFLVNLLKDNDFKEWLNTRRSKKKIDSIIFNKKESESDDEDQDIVAEAQ